MRYLVFLFIFAFMADLAFSTTSLACDESPGGAKPERKNSVDCRRSWQGLSSQSVGLSQKNSLNSSKSKSSASTKECTSREKKVVETLGKVEGPRDMNLFEVEPTIENGTNDPAEFFNGNADVLYGYDYRPVRHDSRLAR